RHRRLLWRLPPRSTDNGMGAEGSAPRRAGTHAGVLSRAPRSVRMSNRFLNFIARAASVARAPEWLQRVPVIYRPLRALFVTLSGGTGSREIVAGPLRGYRIVLGEGDRNAYLINTHERDIVDLAARLCEPGMSVIDIGAHVGHFSLLFSVKVGPHGR